jgi:choice-of-anchor C domain-containing protein
MARLSTLLAALAALGAAPDLARANLLVNGSFETPFAPPGAFSTLSVSSQGLTGWTIGGPTTDSSIDLIDNGYWPAFDGLQSVDLSGTPGPTGTFIEQTFATVPGQPYTLSFNYANNTDIAPLIASAQVDVTSNASLLSYTITHGGSTVTNMNYLLDSRTFLANSASTMLRFTHLGSTGDSDFQGIALDRVSVTAVPEPETYAMMVAGLGLLGFMLRRRRRQPRA